MILRPGDKAGILPAVRNVGGAVPQGDANSRLHAAQRLGICATGARQSALLTTQRKEIIMAKGSKIALIRDFRCETQESYTEYPVVALCANVVIDRWDVLYVDG